MKAAPALRVRHLWQRLGTQDVLRDVSFDVAHGEVFGFIGPNGAGKTTTIRVMSTLLAPTSGRVEVCGHDVALEPHAVRRLIGYMPDYAGVYPNVTVREYLEFFADAHDMTRGHDYRVVEAALELTGLRPLDSKIVASMSKGMKQRLQLARILLHDPKILILDEPASDLDPRARIEMRDLVVELAHLGKTVFLSSHILTELADVCTSVAILERGRLMAAGPVEAIASMLEAHARGDSVEGVANAPREAPERAVKLRVLGALEGTLSELRGVPGVTRVEGTASAGVSTVVLAYRGEERIVAGAVAQLVASGYGVLGVEPERNELERIFMQVTRGEMQ